MENSLFSLGTQEAEHIDALGSPFVMKSRKESVACRINWLMEWVVIPGCCSDLLITGITVSMGEEMIAPDWWSLWVIKAKCLKGCVDEDAWLFERYG